MATKHKRVSREDVRRNAQQTGSKQDFFRLPKEVREWTPDGKGEVSINVLPYLTKTPFHPDNVEPGMIWYKRPFQIHRSIGPNDVSVVCPGSVGKPCPICQERAKLAKNWDENKEAITALNFQQWVVYPIADPDNEDRCAIFAYSYGKFAKPLQKELDEGADENLMFWDVKDGKTLKVRFSEETFALPGGGSAKFLAATRIDFVDRPDMDEDEILAKTPCLDEILKVMDYNRLKALFLQLDTTDASTTPVEETAGEPAARKPDDDKTKDDETPPVGTREPTGTFEVGDKVTFLVGKAETTGEIIEIDGDDYTVKDTKGKSRVLDVTELTAVEVEQDNAEAAAADAETEPTAAAFAPHDKVVLDEDGTEAEVVRVNDAGTKVLVLNADGEKQWVAVGDVTAVTEDAGDKDTPTVEGQCKVGDTVTWMVGKKRKSGEVTAIDDTTLTIEDDNGNVVEMDGDDVDVVPSEPAPAAAAKPGKTGKPEAAAPAAKGKCPQGGTFGKDVDKFGKKCDVCPQWEPCEAASAPPKKK